MRGDYEDQGCKTSAGKPAGSRRSSEAAPRRGSEKKSARGQENKSNGAAKDGSINEDLQVVSHTQYRFQCQTDGKGKEQASTN